MLQPLGPQELLFLFARRAPAAAKASRSLALASHNRGTRAARARPPGAAGRAASRSARARPGTAPRRSAPGAGTAATPGHAWGDRHDSRSPLPAPGRSTPRRASGPKSRAGKRVGPVGDLQTVAPGKGRGGGIDRAPTSATIACSWAPGQLSRWRCGCENAGNGVLEVDLPGTARA